MSMSDSEILRIFKEICMCVALLHSQNPPIAHRDLKVDYKSPSHPFPLSLPSLFGSP